MSRAGAIGWPATLMLAAALACATAAAQAQQDQKTATTDSAAFERGRGIYESNCVACHLASGAGTPPSFPALAGNAKLRDLDLIVRMVRQGQGGMPAFAKLAADEIAALTTYIRNTWSNKFGVVAAAQVTTILTGLATPAGTKVSVWSGVYTAAQNKRGEEFHATACVACHGPRLNGAGQAEMPPSPAIARTSFLRKWAGQTLAALHTYVRQRMPPDSPGTLNDQQSIDAIAHMLAASDIPAGAKELPLDPNALANIVIEVQPK